MHKRRTRHAVHMQSAGEVADTPGTADTWCGDTRGASREQALALGTWLTAATPYRLLR